MSKVLTFVISFLTVCFIAMKAMGHIDWPWGWVLAPLWLPFACGFIAILAALAAALIKGIWETYKQC